MGNLLLTTPAFSAIRQRLPGVHIGFLTTEAYGFMLTHHRDIDVLYLQSRRMTWNWLAQLRLIREVRRQNYDMVVDCSQGESFLGVVWMMLCGASYRVGEKGSRHEALFNLAVDVTEAKEHRIERLLAVLEAVGIPSAGFAMHIPLPPSCQQWAVNQWAFWTSSGGTRRIGINLGARGEKRWPLEQFNKLVFWCLRKGHFPVIFAGPEELDRMAQLDGALPEGVPVDTTHDPLRFAALLQGCSIFITCDTGPMHLAVAVGTPTIAIFRRSNFREYGPLGHRHRIVYDKAGIGLDRVVQAVEDLFGEASQLSSPVESSPNSYPD